MRRVHGDELKMIQLRILDVVSEFCIKNGITYWIDSGTLLGAIRHKGYIPWDDDIDIGMLRADYDRFSREFNKQHDKFRFVCIENTPGFYAPHGKVCDTSTVLYEPDERGQRLAINIDVFVYDNAPDDNEVVEEMYNTRDSLRKVFAIKNQRALGEGNLCKKVLRYLRKMLYRACFRGDMISKMVENSKRYSKIDTQRVGNFTAYTRMVCNKRVFDSFIDVEFEGKFYKAPVGYDEWLRSFYGDYMQLPPEEKRVSHHSFVAYVND